MQNGLSAEKIAVMLRMLMFHFQSTHLQIIFTLKLLRIQQFQGNLRSKDLQVIEFILFLFVTWGICV